MPSVSMSGSDTLSINNRVLTDFGTGDIVMLEYPNDIAGVKTGKNGNSVYGLNETGNNAELKIKVLRGSADDKFLNGLLAQQKNNFAAFVLMIGNFIKKIGDGKGNITSDIYNCNGGVFSKNLSAKSNAEGDTEQSEVTYTIKFSNAPRAIT